MTVEIIHGDARHLPRDDDSVDLIVTSPPYWSLRSYQDNGEHYEGQIGAEATPGEYIDALLDCTREWMRVLRPTGSLWLNLGDSYSGKPSSDGSGRRDKSGAPSRPARRGETAPAKSLRGLPWRYALRCIDDLGLILRAEVIWQKTNSMPSSVTDRVNRTHEQWFHFTLQPRYFSAVDEIRDPHTADRARGTGGYDGASGVRRHWFTSTQHALGKLPGSVWEVATQPLRVPDALGVSHFAAFPIEWPLRIIRGWSPTGICTECGEGRRPVAQQTDEAYAAERARVRANRSKRTDRESSLGDTFGGPGGRTNTGGFSDISNGVVKPDYRITGYACACPAPTAPTRPSVVLDPFGGTGTTALAADVLGRHGISVDASQDYCRIAQWRTTDPGERARAMGVPKPEPEMEGQLSLLDALEAS